MPQYWKKFHAFFCNWQMYISSALFINSLDIFFFFCNNYKQSAVSEKTYVHFLLIVVFANESFHLFTVRQKGVGGGYHSIRYGFSVAVKTISIPVHVVFVSSLTLLHKLVTFQLRQKCEELEREILARSSVEVPTTPDSMSVKSNQSQQWAQSSAV